MNDLDYIYHFNRFLITILYLFILSIIIITLVLKKNISFERKIMYFSFAFILLNPYKGFSSLLVCIPFILLLFLPYIEKRDDSDSIFDYIKKNLLVFIGLIAIIGIQLNFQIFGTYFKYLSITPDSSLAILIYCRFIFLLIILSSSLIIL
ncbi:MAG: hypothetical protein ACFFAN_03325 [Promethearchaeota archaeon]